MAVATDHDLRIRFRNPLSTDFSSSSSSASSSGSDSPSRRRRRSLVFFFSFVPAPVVASPVAGLL